MAEAIIIAAARNNSKNSRRPPSLLYINTAWPRNVPPPNKQTPEIINIISFIFEMFLNFLRQNRNGLDSLHHWY